MIFDVIVLLPLFVITFHWYSCSKWKKNVHDRIVFTFYHSQSVNPLLYYYQQLKTYSSFSYFNRTLLYKNVNAQHEHDVYNVIKQFHTLYYSCKQNNFYQESKNQKHFEIIADKIIFFEMAFNNVSFRLHSRFQWFCC